ncbi:hypothetical protein H0H93_003725 [Arthromyces matolae]|nr:hypothetical protein H0H93_003725 [Arthromyces matolae]
MPTVEVVRFPASDAYVADKLVFKDCLDILVKSEGLWESYEHHIELTKRDDIYPNLIASIRLAQSGPIDMQHVNFDGDATRALESPVTEVVVLSLKERADGKESRSLVAELGTNLISQKECHSVVVGESMENKGVVFMLLGWDSVEAHVKAVSEGVFPEIIDKLNALNGIEIAHTKLTRYST